MLFHALLIMLISYVLMRYVLGQSSSVAEDRSVLLGGVVLVYMVLFGHGLPGRVNPRIM
jgi:TRAP-type C4-dicarboxylate transport system permease small subunit